tara:strand:- start:33 stop:1055 length:1023 start_codon:yes stop_codon:yes gene_type:complete
MSEVNELVEFDKITAGIADIQEKGNFIPDMSTKEGYEASKRFVLDITTPTRTKLDKAHKVAKAYWVSGGKNVDSKKNEILNLLVDIQKPHQDAYKEHDQIAKDKKAKFEDDLQVKIDFFNNFKFESVGSSDFISALIQSCGEADTAEGFYHRAIDAEAAKKSALEYLNDLLMSTVTREAEEQRQANLAEENRLRQIEIDAQQECMRLQQEEINRKQAEIDRVENEAKAMAESEANEKKRLIDESERAEREKNAAIEREEYAKKQAEIAASEATEREKQRQYSERVKQDADRARLEADKAHTGSVRAEIKEHIMKSCGLDNALATKVVKSLLKTNRVTINY